MPELPEVETIRRELKPVIIGRRIERVKVLWPKTVAPTSARRFQTSLRGQTVTGLGRRAKILLIKLANNLTLTIHLKMTGQLIYRHSEYQIVGGHPQAGGADNLPNRFTRLVLDFDNRGQLFFNDARKFGWSRLLTGADQAELIRHFGPEPLTRDFSQNYLAQLAARYPRRPIKALLLDQTLIAGLGNIYADESCFRAGLQPARLAGSLKPANTARLHQAIQQILKLAISKKGTSARDYRRPNGQQGNFADLLQVYGRGGKPCLVCRQIVIKNRLVRRGTHSCPRCQH
ncbi:MAG: bifunctional DNA-formamidopyrimidine glycosylase/DNA-(apurinic or apyrimidinic site) lyase [Patescibacteria group bacterium]